MKHNLPRSLLGLVLALGVVAPLLAAEPDLSDFKTVDTALTTTIKRGEKVTHQLPAYLGVQVATTAQSNLFVAAVAPDSPADKAGLKKDDLILTLADKELPDAAAFSEQLLSHHADDEVKLTIVRKNRLQDVTVKLGATSRPL